MKFDIMINGELVRWVEAKSIDLVMKHIEIVKTPRMKKGVRRWGFPIKLGR